MRFSNFLNKALMGKRIMHSARALFLTFLALEKSKRNSTFYENCAAAERGKVGKRFAAEKLCRSIATAAEQGQCIPKSRDTIYSGAERDKIYSGARPCGRKLEFYSS